MDNIQSDLGRRASDCFDDELVTAVDDAKQSMNAPTARTRRPITNFPLLPIISPRQILADDPVGPQDVRNDHGQSFMDYIIEKEC